MAQPEQENSKFIACLGKFDALLGGQGNVHLAKYQFLVKMEFQSTIIYETLHVLLQVSLK